MSYRKQQHQRTLVCDKLIGEEWNGYINREEDFLRYIYIYAGDIMIGEV
jgi:hypothetical protein